MRATLERHPATRLGKLMRAASIAKVVAKVLSCIGKYWKGIEKVVAKVLSCIAKVLDRYGKGIAKVVARVNNASIGGIGKIQLIFSYASSSSTS